MTAGSGERAFYAANYVLLAVITVTTVFPFLNTVAVSFSGERAVLSGEVAVLPVEPTVDTYRSVMKRSPILVALRNTAFVTVVGTLVNMILTVLAAYPLSKQRLRGRSAILVLITFTMLFGAGMIPDYLLVRSLGLVNTYWALWLPGAVSTFNMIVLKTFFSGIPESLEDSAMIDGANDLRILLRIVLPLSLPALATVALFYAVSHWNSYMNVLIYITSTAKYTLQMRLRQLLFDSSMMASITGTIQDSQDAQSVAQESIKAASIVIATVPILLVYPFLQKYFVKGVMIGSIKG